MIYWENSKMIIKIVFIFTVLSIIGNLNRGIQCMKSELLDNYIEFDIFTMDLYNRMCFSEFYNHMANLSTDTDPSAIEKLQKYYTGLIRVIHELDLSSTDKLQNYYNGFIHVNNVDAPGFNEFVYSATTFYKKLLALQPDPEETRVMAIMSNGMISMGIKYNLWEINTFLNTREDYKKFNAFTLDIPNRKYFSEFYNHMTTLSTNTELNPSAIKELQQYYAGLIRVFDVDVPGLNEFVYSAKTFYEKLLALQPDPEETRVMEIMAKGMIFIGGKCNLWDTNTFLNNREDSGSSSNNVSNKMEIFDQCANTFNLLTTPTEYMSTLVQKIILKYHEFDNLDQRADFVPIELRYGNILLLLKNEKEEELFSNLTEEIQTSYIVFLLMETVEDILHGMNSVLAGITTSYMNLSTDTIQKLVDHDDVKMELLQSMYETVVDTARIVYFLASINNNNVLKSPSKEENRDKSDEWQFEISYYDKYLAECEKSIKYFIRKWEYIMKRTSEPLLFPTTGLGEGRLFVRDVNGLLNVRLSMFGYYHIFTRDMEKEQRIEDIINNDEVHFLLEVKLWLLTVFQFACAMDIYNTEHGINETPDDNEEIMNIFRIYITKYEKPLFDDEEDSLP